MGQVIGVALFRLSITIVSMSLTGSCFSSESAPGPFHHGIRRRGGTIFGAALPLDKRQVQADIRSHLIHRPARDIIPPLGGPQCSPVTVDLARLKRAKAEDRSLADCLEQLIVADAKKAGGKRR